MQYDNVYPYETKNGTRYMYRVKYYSDDGKRHEKQKRGFESARLAYKASLETLLAIEDNRVDKINMDTLTVNQAVELYMEDKQNEWQPSTLNTKRRVFNTIHDNLGKMKVKDVNAINYKRTLNTLYKGLKSGSIEAYNKTIKALFTWLVDNDLLDKNKLSKVHYSTKSEQNRIMQPKELQLFLSTLEKHKQTDTTAWFALNFLLRTGCRRGELLGLKWEDVTDDGKMHIHRTRSELGVRETTKTGTKRTIYMGKTLLEMFNYYRSYKLKEYLRLGQPFNESLFMITNRSLYRLSTPMLYHYMKAIQEEAGFTDHYTVHSLRHANATYSLSADNNIKAVQSRLGHSDSQTTMKYYVEDLDSVNKQYADDIDKFFNSI